MNAHDLRLDYFQVYDAANQRVGESVALMGQFDKEPERGRLLFLDLFANPVSKNDEPIYDKNAHFTCYYLYEPAPEPTRVVIAENQFGTHELFIGNAVRLLVPAQKLDRRTVFPRELDHYKVYRVLEGRPVDAGVALRDQFMTSDAKVTYPYGFAVPVKKEHEGRTFPIHNEKAHLILYKMSPRSFAKPVKVRDQFGGRYLYVYRAILLAVPSVKHEWKEVE
jgi:hypothetical protein